MTRRTYFLGGLLIFLVLMSYAAFLALVSYAPPVRGAGFIWDDDFYITNNDTLKNTAGLRRIWFDLGATPQYYPLVFSTFWLEFHLWEYHPLGYHLDNVLLHALGTLLLWRLLVRLQLPGAWFAAALFGLHPVHVESVAWASERKNVLSGVFYFLAALTYFRARPLETGQCRSYAWYAAALLLFLGALLCKTVTCSLPAVLVLLIWWKQGRITRTDALALAPFFALGLVLALVTVQVEKHHVGAAGEEWAFTPVDRCLIAGRALWFYAGKLLWPSDPAFIYPRWHIDSSAAWQYVFPLAALAVLLGLWLLRDRLGRGPLVAVLIFAGTLLPALGFFDIYPMRYSFVADHFQYLASVGLLCLFAALAARAAAWVAPALRVTVVACTLLFLGTLTCMQSMIYQDVVLLWEDTLVKNPDCWMAHHNLAATCFERGKLHEAVYHTEETLRLYPQEPKAAANLVTMAQALAQQNKIEDALHAVNVVIASRPEHSEAYLLRGELEQKKGNLAAAESDYRSCLRWNDANTAACFDLGSLCDQQGRLDEAEMYYTRTAELVPSVGLAPYRLGRLHLEQGRRKEALRWLRQAVALQPDVPLYHYGLAAALHRLGEEREVEEQLRQARGLAGWAEAATECAWSLATHPRAGARDGTLAVRLARAACEVTAYKHPLPLDALACAEAETSRFQDAVAHARQALTLLASNPIDQQRAEQVRTRLVAFEQQRPFRDVVR